MIQNIAGVILAGGKSSRMGQNKVLMEYKGQTLLDVMAEKLKSLGVSDIWVSGKQDGYRCLPDKTPEAGPAQAILDMAPSLKCYEGVLFIPVDIPLVKEKQLQALMEQKEGGFFENDFLPVYIPVAKLSSLKQSQFEGRKVSVRRLIKLLDIKPLSTEDDDCLLNVNTPEVYEELLLKV